VHKTVHRSLSSIIARISPLQVRSRTCPLVPSIFETQPAVEDYQLQQQAREGVAGLLQSLQATPTVMNQKQRASGEPPARDTPLGGLWRLMVAAMASHVPHSQDPTLMTYVHTPRGVAGLHVDLTRRKGSLPTQSGALLLHASGACTVAWVSAHASVAHMHGCARMWRLHECMVCTHACSCWPPRAELLQCDARSCWRI
jgi:hypothetical protein